MLEDYCADLNSRSIGRASGTEWFVNQRRRDDGSVERYLDRRDISLRRSFWQPTEAEIAMTNEVVAECERKGMTVERFNQLVRDGTITREVAARLRARQAEPQSADW